MGVAVNQGSQYHVFRGSLWCLEVLDHKEIFSDVYPYERASKTVFKDCNKWSLRAFFIRHFF